MNLQESTPLERRVKDNATEAKKLLAAHDKTLDALVQFQKENAKDNEARIHPGDYANLVLADYAKSILE